MSVKLRKDSIDLGIVTTNAEAMIGFYRDILGFADNGDLSIPGATIRMLGCGTSVIKIVSLSKDPPGAAPPGGIRGATGYRYWTMSVSNLPEVVAACEEAGHRIAVPLTEMRPGTKVAIVEDPDGNWVEFLDAEES